jgi:predicted nucleic acid-binding protein
VILLDTNVLVALTDPSDALGPAAAADLKSLSKSGGLYLFPPILVEACFLLPHQSFRARLAALLETLDVRPCAAPDEKHFWSEVFGWIKKYEKHDPDWVDGCLAVLSGYEPRCKVWTYDREFRTIWRRPDGTKIPVAGSKN